MLPRRTAAAIRIPRSKGVDYSYMLVVRWDEVDYVLMLSIGVTVAARWWCL